MKDRGSVKLTHATLRSIKLFARLQEPVLSDVLARCRGRKFAAGARIVASHDQDNDVYFIVTGRCKVESCPVNGRDIIHDMLREGDMFGELAALDGKARSTDVKVDQDAVMAVMSGQAFLELLHRYPAELGEPTMQHLTTMIRRLVSQAYEDRVYPVRCRIRRYLLRLARAHEPVGNTVVIEGMPQRKDIGARVGTEPGAVSREYNCLARMGLLTKHRNSRCEFHDIAGLETLIRKDEEDD